MLLALRNVSVSSATPAQDMASDDFRVRMAATMVLARTRPPEARQLLEKALSDPHPAVRTAAAAGLGDLGDPAAVAALEKHLETEGSPGVHAQLETSLARLRGGGSGAAAAVPAGAKYIVKLGAMKNLTNVRGEQLTEVMRTSAKQKAAAIPGAMIAENAPPSAKMPILVLDGSLIKMAQQPKADGSVAISAEVEFSIRKVPEHVLKASLSGAATSVGTARSLTTAAKINALQDAAVDGAVESAMRNADRGLSIAAK